MPSDLAKAALEKAREMEATRRRVEAHRLDAGLYTDAAALLEARADALDRFADQHLLFGGLFSLAKTEVRHLRAAAAELREDASRG